MSSYIKTSNSPISVELKQTKKNKKKQKNKKKSNYTRRVLPVTRSMEKKENRQFKSLLRISHIEPPLQKLYRMQQSTNRTIPEEQKLFQISATIEQLHNYVNLTTLEIDMRSDCFIQSLFAAAIIKVSAAKIASSFANIHDTGIVLNDALNYIIDAFGIPRDKLTTYTFYNSDIYKMPQPDPINHPFYPTPIDDNGVSTITNYLDINLLPNYLTFMNISFLHDESSEDSHAIVCIKVDERLLFFDPQHNEEGLYETLYEYLYGMGRVSQYVFFWFSERLRKPITLKNDSCHLRIYKY
jgi:hypothetical protein